MQREKTRRAPWRRLVRGARGPRRGGLGIALERFSRAVTEWAGTSWAFALALAVIVAWAATGPIFRFSDTWQLVINTGTTIVTFLMVFLSLLHRHYARLVALARETGALTESHSVEEAAARHALKLTPRDGR